MATTSRANRRTAPMTLAALPHFTLKLPDDLLAWGKLDANAIHFARPWSHDIENLLAVATSQQRPLGHMETERLLNSLSALVHEAIRAGRKELLHGLDTFTAEWIGLAYELPLVDGRVVTIGHDGRYRWGELREVLATDDPRSAAKFTESVKDLLAESFPTARITEVWEGRPPDVCASCTKPVASAMMLLDTGLVMCPACWLDATKVPQAD